MSTKKLIEKSVPFGPLGIIALSSCKEMGQRVNDYIVNWRKQKADEIEYLEEERDSYLIKTSTPRFGSGEAKGMINETIRGDDIYILVDVCNYSITYSLCGHQTMMSPDDHFADLKRIIGALGGKARRITVIMPFLYESRQHKRSGRESLDCAIALQELHNMGVDNIITFDAHDPRVQNAIPLGGFETVQPSYQFIKHLLAEVPDLQLDSDHMMIISPDEGATGRAVYYATVLGIDMGMFYKRRDYSQVVNGRNPIVAHEFLGSNVEGKDVFIIDDMISSGDSMIDTAKELKRRKARRVFIASTFGLFTNGLEKFDEAVKAGYIDKVLTTNLIYQTPELLTKDWYINVDMTKYLALLIDTLHHDGSISSKMNPTVRIKKAIAAYQEKQNEK